MRFGFDPQKSRQLKENPKRGIGLDQATQVFSSTYVVDQSSDDPEQFRAIGWVAGSLYSVIFEVRHDELGEYYHLITLWKATRQEEISYAESVG